MQKNSVSYLQLNISKTKTWFLTLGHRDGARKKHRGSPAPSLPKGTCSFPHWPRNSNLFLSLCLVAWFSQTSATEKNALSHIVRWSRRLTGESQGNPSMGWTAITELNKNCFLIWFISSNYQNRCVLPNTFFSKANLPTGVNKVTSNLLHKSEEKTFLCNFHARLNKYDRLYHRNRNLVFSKEKQQLEFPEERPIINEQTCSTYLPVFDLLSFHNSG